MASINSLVKRKQFLWLGIVLAAVGVVGGGGWYLADVRYDGTSPAQSENEPAPDMTGVVDSTFDQKVQQHATTEMQATASDMRKQYEQMRSELDLLSKGQSDYQKQINKLSQDNAALSAQVSALGARPVTAAGEPAPQPPEPAPGPEGEPQPVAFPPQTQMQPGAVPPPTAFYPGNGVTPPPQVQYQPIPVPNQLRRQSFPVRKRGGRPCRTSHPAASPNPCSSRALTPTRPSPVTSPRCRCSCASPDTLRCPTAKTTT